MDLLILIDGPYLIDRNSSLLDSQYLCLLINRSLTHVVDITLALDSIDVQLQVIGLEVLVSFLVPEIDSGQGAPCTSDPANDTAPGWGKVGVDCVDIIIGDDIT